MASFFNGHGIINTCKHLLPLVVWVTSVNQEHISAYPDCHPTVTISTLDTVCAVSGEHMHLRVDRDRVYIIGIVFYVLYCRKKKCIRTQWLF